MTVGRGEIYIERRGHRKRK